MRPLRLGTFQLSPAEAGLIRALVQLFASGDTSELNWQYVDEAPYDVLVVDANVKDMAAVRSLNKAGSLLKVGEAVPGAGAGPEMMVRPIRRDKLEVSLLHFQHQILQGGSGREVINVQEADSAIRIAGAMLRQDDPGNASAQPRFKLRRWPPAELLHNDASRIRMATLLSKRPMLMSEMVEMSRQPIERCKAFIQLLQGFNLIDAHLPLAVQATLPGALETYPPAPRHRARGNEDRRWSLVRGIRQRLGL